MRQILAVVALGTVIGLAPLAAMADENAPSSPATPAASSSVDVTSNGNGAQQLDPSDGEPAYLQAPAYLRNNQ